MAMSKILLQSVPRASLRPPTALISNHRQCSSKNHRGQLLELELELEGASSSQHDAADAAAEIITVGINRLEDAIHGLIARRAAPSWIPFLPGYSYWVPPRDVSMRNRPVMHVAEAIGEFRNRFVSHDLSKDQQMSLTSNKGWPSVEFFIDGTPNIHPIPVIEMDLKVQDNEDLTDGPSNCGDTGR